MLRSWRPIITRLPAFRLLADKRGVTAMFLALAAVPVVIAAGMGVDVARAYAERVRLGHALDAAALAVGSTQGTPAQIQARLNQFFYGNYPTTAAGKPVSVAMTTDATGNVITLTDVPGAPVLSLGATPGPPQGARHARPTQGKARCPWAG